MVILFDIDDTLLDDLAAKVHYMPMLYRDFKRYIKFTEEEFYVKWREAIPKYHKKYSDGEMTFEEQRAARVHEAFGDAGLAPSVVGEVVRAFNAYYEQGWKPFTETISILEHLKGFPMGIISNGSAKQQQRKIDALGVRKYFDCILISEDVGVSKPDKRIFMKACEHFKCDPTECYYIGDSWELDIIGSGDAGMKPVWLNRYKKPLPKRIDNMIEVFSLGDIEKIFS